MSVPFRICKRPAGDYAIQRFESGRIVRWGLYRTLRQAEAHLPIANVSIRPIADVLRALSTEGSPA
jgi:hypothetical protein